MLWIGYRVAYGDVGKTREVDDLARRRRFGRSPLQRLNRQQGGDLLAWTDARLADADHVLARAKGAARNPPNREPPDVIVVIEVAHHECHRPFRVAQRWRNVGQRGIEQGSE